MVGKGKMVIASDSQTNPSNTVGVVFRWRELIGIHTFLLMALIAALCVILTVVSAYLVFSPTGKNDQYAVFLPPWVNYAKAVVLLTSMDGLVVDMNDKTNFALIYLKRQDAVSELYRAGALLVLDPGKLGDLSLKGVCTSASGK